MREPNDSRRPDPRRDRARELARLLATEEGARLARLLQQEGYLAPGERPAAPAPESPAGPRPISIWQPRTVGKELVFRRPEPGPFGDHHAARREIPARKAPGTRRLCLFGESAAAGYLYAPHLTPAGLLERQLAHLLGEAAWEVVDLARTNETLEPMAATLEASLQLGPDLLVIFAGNNWDLLETPELSPYAPSVRARQRYARALAREGLAGPARLGRRRLEAKAGSAFARIARAAEEAGAPVLLLLPEANLADWESRQPVTWLPGGGSRRWHELRALAEERLAEADYPAAEAAAREVLALDGGLCPTGHRLLAEALLGQGREREAEKAAREEVESDTYSRLCFLSAPRAGEAAREVLLRVATEHGFGTVDLREVFRRREAGSLPGRRLFLDYCHLGLEGMHLAMAAVAAEVLGREPAEVLARLPSPEACSGVRPEARATARLGAALHGAHRHLSRSPAILEHWCRHALEASPEALHTLADLALARAAPGPAVLTSAQQRNLASPQRLLLQHGWRWDGLDPELLKIALLLLRERGSPAAAEEIETALVRHHGIGPEGRELSRPPYLWQPLERFFPEVMAFADLTGRATLRCPWPETSFCLVADGAKDLRLECRLRLPAFAPALAPREGEAELSLAGEPLARLPLGESWSVHRVDLPRRLLGRTLHRLTLRWPPLPTVEGPLAAAIHRLEQGLEADLHPVFGEIYSLRGRTLDDG